MRIKGTSWARSLETVAVQNLHLPLTAVFCPSSTGPPESVSHCMPDTRFLDFAQKSNFATEPPHGHKKHLVQRQLGRLAPTPYLKYRAYKVMQNMPAVST
jgi:hypothetical protein